MTKRIRTGRSILRATPDPRRTPQAHKFLTELQASGLRGRALKQLAEDARQKLAEKRLQNRQ